MRDLLQAYLAKDLMSLVETEHLKKAELAKNCYLSAGKFWRVVSNKTPSRNPYVYARIYFATGLESAANLMHHFGLGDEEYRGWRDKFAKNPTLFPSSEDMTNVKAQDLTDDHATAFKKWIDELVAQLIKYRDDAGFKSALLLAEYIGVNERVLRSFLLKKTIPRDREFYLKVFQATNLPAANPTNIRGDAYHPKLVPMTDQEFQRWSSDHPSSRDLIGSVGVQPNQSLDAPVSDNHPVIAETPAAIENIEEDLSPDNSAQESPQQSIADGKSQNWLLALVSDGVDSFFDTLTRGVNEQIRLVVQDELSNRTGKHQSGQSDSHIIQLINAMKDLTNQLMAAHEAEVSTNAPRSEITIDERSRRSVASVDNSAKIAPKQLQQLVKGLLEVLSDLVQRGSVEERSKLSHGLGPLFAQLRPYVNAFTYDSPSDREEALSLIRKITL